MPSCHGRRYPCGWSPVSDVLLEDDVLLSDEGPLSDDEPLSEVLLSDVWLPSPPVLRVPAVPSSVLVQSTRACDLRTLLEEAALRRRVVADVGLGLDDAFVHAADVVRVSGGDRPAPGGAQTPPEHLFAASGPL